MGPLTKEHLPRMPVPARRSARPSLTHMRLRQKSWQRIGGESPPRGRSSQPPRPRVMHEFLLARAAVKRSQGETTGQVLSCETGLIPRCRSYSEKEKATSSMAYWLAWKEPCAVGDLVHVGKFFARNLGGLIRARTCAGPAREGKSRTPSMYAGKKSDEVVVPRKRPNKGRQLPAEVVEGRASPEGNSRQAAVVRTLSRAATSIRLAAVRRSACGFTPCVRPTFDPREEPGALAAHAGICAGGAQ